MFCPKCGTNLPGNSEFCSNCGNRIEQQVVVSTNENNKKKLDKKTLLIIIGIAIALLVLVISLFLIFKPKNKTTKEEFTTNSSYDQITTAKDEKGRTKYIGGNFTDVNVKDESGAYEALDSLKDVLKFNNVKEEFTTESIDTSKDITYYRFHQKYNEVEVYGTNLIISVDKYGNVLSMNGYYIPDIKLDVNPKISKEAAELIVKGKLNSENVTVVNTNKYIYVLKEKPTLVYVINAYDDNNYKEYIINANDGTILSETDSLNFEAYEYEGRGVEGLVKVTIDKYFDVNHMATKYRLVDPTRNIEIVDLNGLDTFTAAISSFLTKYIPMSGDIDGYDFVYPADVNEYRSISKSGLSALNSFENIYDYYYNVLGRKSYDNNGAKIIINIGVREHLLGRKLYQNACWAGDYKQIFIGGWDGKPFVNVKDVLGHEFTHAVISYTSKFAKFPQDPTKANEQSALNEGIADIIGSIIEGENWTMAEKIGTFRDAANPLANKYPSEKDGEYYYPDGYLNKGMSVEEMLRKVEEENNLDAGSLKEISDFDNNGEHQNSTVVYHAAYLMQRNGAFESWDDEAILWYNALYLMNSYSNFEDCALAVIQTARNLGYSEDKVKIIYDAFVETKMLENKEVKFSGTVSSVGEIVSGATITISSLDDPSIKYTVTSDEDGEFEQKLKKGNYEIVVKKDGYNEFKEQISITGDTILSIELPVNIKANVNREMCTTNNCHTFIIWQMTGENNEIKEEKLVYLVDHGTVIGTDLIVDSVNSVFGNDFLKSDGKTFTMSMGGMDIDYGWYYRNTDTKVDFKQPITRDVAIELKMMDGMFDYSSLKKINDMFTN